MAADTAGYMLQRARRNIVIASTNASRKRTSKKTGNMFKPKPMNAAATSNSGICHQRTLHTALGISHKPTPSAAASGKTTSRCPVASATATIAVSRSRTAALRIIELFESDFLKSLISATIMMMKKSQKQTGKAALPIVSMRRAPRRYRRCGCRPRNRRTTRVESGCGNPSPSGARRSSSRIL